MASHYWGANRGYQQHEVVNNTSTTSKDAELVVDLTKNMTKKELLIALDLIKNDILHGTYPAQ